MAVAFDEPHRPAHPLQFLTVLGNQRPMSDGVPFGDELVSGAHEYHPLTSQRRDGISLRPVPNTSVKRRMGVSSAAARCDFRDRERLPILTVERRPTATDQRRQPIRTGGELQPHDAPPGKAKPCKPVSARRVCHGQDVSATSRLKYPCGARSNATIAGPDPCTS